MTNGFGPPDGDLQLWDPTAFESPGPGAVLLKLHGSVDWCRVRPWVASAEDELDSDPESERLAIVRPVDEPRDASNRVWERMDAGRPRLLVGTFNKMLEYTREPFFDLHGAFVGALRQTNRLVVCGYGFGDKGVNRFLIEWMARDRENRMVVVDPGAESIANRARGAIRQAWKRWFRAERLRLLPSPLASVRWERTEGIENLLWS